MGHSHREKVVPTVGCATADNGLRLLGIYVSPFPEICRRRRLVL